MTGNAPISRSRILTLLAEDLGLSDTQRQLLRDTYGDLGRWLSEHAKHGPRDVRVYPQGSVRIGTVTSKTDTGEFDGDLVLRVDYRKHEVSQNELNELAGGWLGAYTSRRHVERHPLAPSKVEKKQRAWTLSYDGRFHLDVLPVVPDDDVPDNAPSDPSWLTDRHLTRWQPTDPRGFATWFDQTAQQERAQLKVMKAAERQVDIDDLPDHEVPTSLQLSVRLLKKHRDGYFGADPDDLAPPSIVLTTLAARAYAARTPNGGDLATVLAEIADGMPGQVQRHNGVLWVPNPVNPEENFADRYAGRADREQALTDWLSQVTADLGELGGGLDRAATVIDKRFGSGRGERVVSKLTEQVQDARKLGQLGSTSTGGLMTGAVTRSHREHRFYGQTPS